MLKDGVKALLFKNLSLVTQRRLVNALIRNIILTASRDDVSLLDDLFASLDWLQVGLEDRIRQIKRSGRHISAVPSSSAPIRTYLMEEDAPWRSVSVDPIAMPGMITNEESKYYEYIGASYRGQGEIIELGPWLGKSTRHIIRGLVKNPIFANKRLNVFDDFVWRCSWMDRYVPENERLPNHADFRHLFETYVCGVRDLLNVTKAKITDHDGNEHLPRIQWNEALIEIMYIDCGRTFQANEGWFEVFSRSLIPDVTLLIMQDWRTHRERPRQSYNHTFWFTEAHPEFELVHEVKDGGIGAFLYRGT